MATPLSISKLQGRTKYPYHQWFDGQVWELKKGADYTVSTRNMSIMMYQAAAMNEVKIRINKMDDETLRIQCLTVKPMKKPSTKKISTKPVPENQMLLDPKKVKKAKPKKTKS